MTESSKQATLLATEVFSRKPEPAALVPTPVTGTLVTNHMNLMYMLAAGLLMPPSGFGGKHYHDTLAAFPGWLPFFVGGSRQGAQARRAAVADSTTEAKYLEPVILEVDLTGLRGSVHAFGAGGWASRQLEEGLGRGEWLVLAPAPLPVSRIRSILFRSPAEKKKVEVAAAERRNVPLAAFARKSAKSRFSGSASHGWLLPDGPEQRSAALPAAQAAGGVMAALQQMANAGDLSVQACRAAFESSAAPPEPSILRGIPGWMRGGTEADVGEAPGTGRALFWGAVQRLIERQSESDGHRAEDSLIGFLRASSENMEGERKAGAARLVSTLEALGGGLGGGTVREMLEKHRTPLARAAILFLLRQKTSELLELIDDYPELEERDRLAAGVLFGVRDGWLGLPVSLRGLPKLAHAVTHRMAVLAHRLDGSEFDLGEAPPRVRPLRELFSESDGWGPKEEKAAVKLANGLKWDCVRTTVSLGRGTYAFRIERGRMHIDFEGEPKVATRVDRDAFIELLSRHHVDPRIEAAVRKDLGL